MLGLINRLLGCHLRAVDDSALALAVLYLIKDALKRPKLMKRVSMATFLYGVSLSLAAYCVHLQL